MGNWAPTAAASTTPIPRTRSRTRPPDQLDRDLPAAGDRLRCRARSGRMIESRKQGYAIVAVMAGLALISVSLMLRFQLQAHGTVPTAVGSAMEGGAALRGGRFRGLRRRHHPDVDRCGGLVPRLLYQPRRDDDVVQHAARRVAPGGTGSAWRHADFAVITVFVAGLMVGAPRVPGQEDHPTRDQARRKLFPGDTATCAHRDRWSPWPCPDSGPQCSTRVRTVCPRCCTPSPRPPTTTVPPSPAWSVNTDWVQHPRSGLAMVLGRFLPTAGRCPGGPAGAGRPHPWSQIGTPATHALLPVGAGRGDAYLAVAPHILARARVLGPLV